MQEAPRTKMRWRSRLLSLLVLGALSLIYFWSMRFKAPQHLDLVALKLTTTDHKALSPSMFQGKAVILNFWAPWCGPCNLEAPWLQALQDKHRNDLLVIGVDDDSDTEGQIVEFALRTNVRYPLVTTNTRVHDAIGTLAGVPTTLYIDRAGDVVHTVTGAIQQPLMEQFAKDALKR